MIKQKGFSLRARGPQGPEAKAFTLIELLVVIAIIGLLMTIAIAGTSYLKARGRDTKRVANISEIRKALVMYSSEKGLGFPVHTGICLKGDDEISNKLKTAGVASNIPSDISWPNTAPGSGAHCYYYVSSEDGTTFSLSYYLELNSGVGTQGTHSVGP